MIEDFVLRAILAGSGVAVVAGPLGAFVVWRRMVYFGEALAHSALLGLVVGYLLEIDLLLAMLAFSMLLAGLLTLLEEQQLLPTDTILGILAHGALSLGLVLLSLVEWSRIDLMGFLFGDILATTSRDLWVVAALVVVGGIVLFRLWRPLLAIAVEPDLAMVEGVPVGRTRLGFNLLLAATIAIGMKVVGIILVVSLLVVPAAAARTWARSPRRMAELAALLGLLATWLGVLASLLIDVPTGPAIVLAATSIFAVGAALHAIRQWRERRTTVVASAELGSPP